jgi:hypothetical protein
MKMLHLNANAETTERLRRHLGVANVPHEWHDRVITACQACGLLASSASKEVNAAASTGGRLEQIAAAAQTPAGVAKLQLAMGELNRLGISLETAVDTTALHAALKGYPPERRMQVKAILAAAKIIP